MTHNHFGFQQQGKWGEIILTPQPHLFVLLKNGTLFFFKGRRALSFYLAGGAEHCLQTWIYVSGGVFFLQFGQRPPAHTPLLAEL